MKGGVSSRFLLLLAWLKQTDTESSVMIYFCNLRRPAHDILAPNVGLEHATLRLKYLFPTNWASL